MINQGTGSQSFSRRRRLQARYVVPALLALIAVAIVALGVLTVTSKPALAAGEQSLGAISLPLGGGTIVHASAIAGKEQKAVPVRVVGNEVWPVGKLPPGDPVTIDVTIKRPGWISWLSGATQQVKLTETTPASEVTSKFITRHRGDALHIEFSQPITVYSYRTASGHMKRVRLTAAQTRVTIPETAIAGTVDVAGAARDWERMTPTAVSWFPAGAHAGAVASPAPGTSITPSTGITLTFSKPVSKALGRDLPVVSPANSGSWHTLNSHTIRYVPTGYGYGLGANVAIHLPAGITLVGGQIKGSDPVAHWSVPAGSTTRLQQLLATLGYLPLRFHQDGSVAPTMAAQEKAAVSPPAGTFSWRYGNTPADLKQMWNPHQWTELTKGAVMSFENQQGMPVDGLPGPAVWKALIDSAIAGHRSTFGYTFVHVSEGSPETVTVWHSGKVVVHGLANTGIAAAPTATGTFAVFEHLPVTTMSGTNPDGTTYHDPGIQWVSYFNGGDALHEFPRGSYGFPQSLGCVEMPLSEAAAVYPYTPIGTIVNVVS